MPYALFDGDIRISRAYPTSDEVWTHAREAGLVIDKVPEESGARHVLDQDIRSGNAARTVKIRKRTSGRPNRPLTNSRF